MNTRISKRITIRQSPVLHKKKTPFAGANGVVNLPEQSL